MKPGCDVTLNHIFGGLHANLNTRLSTQEIRVLDPILYELLDPSILRIPTTFKVRGREIPGFLYERPFDQSIVNHLLETLLSMVTFGGQGFAKAARTSSIKRSYHSGLMQRVAISMCITSGMTVKPKVNIFLGNLVDSEASYLDVLVELLLRYCPPILKLKFPKFYCQVCSIGTKNCIGSLYAAFQCHDPV